MHTHHICTHNYIHKLHIYVSVIFVLHSLLLYLRTKYCLNAAFLSILKHVVHASLSCSVIMSDHGKRWWWWWRMGW